MKAETKLALRRFTLRWLRKLVDVADDRLHAAEVQLRNDLSGARDRQHPTLTALRTEDMLHQATGDQPSESETPHAEVFAEWTKRRSGGVPVAKKRNRVLRRRTAADFDAQIAAKRREYVQ